MKFKRLADLDLKGKKVFIRKLRIVGDTELWLITKNLLDSVEWPFSQWLLKRGMSA